MPFKLALFKVIPKSLSTSATPTDTFTPAIPTLPWNTKISALVVALLKTSNSLLACKIEFWIAVCTPPSVEPLYISVIELSDTLLVLVLACNASIVSVALFKAPFTALTILCVE